MNPRDVVEARASYRSARKTGGEQAQEYLNYLATQMNLLATQLEVSAEPVTLSSWGEMNQGGWVDANYVVYEVNVPVSVKLIGRRTFNVAQGETMLTVDSENVQDTQKVLGMIYSVALNHYDEAKKLLTE